MPLALVTGGCGFIGRHVSKVLLGQGYDVRILDVAEPRAMPGEIDIRRGSILDADDLAAAMAGATHVFHIAGISQFWTERAGELAEVNARGTELVLAAAARAGVARFVHCSTETVLLPPDRHRDAVDEERLPPLSAMPGPYTSSKHAAERAALTAAEEGLHVVIATPTVPVGAQDYNLTPPAAMLMRFLRGAAPVFLDCTLNIVAVQDVAKGMVLAAERGRSGHRYVLGGENLSLREILSRVARLSGRPMPTVALPGPAALAVGIAAGWFADNLTRRMPPATSESVRVALRSAPFLCTKARRELGYDPLPADLALAEAVRWLTSGLPEPRPALPIGSERPTR